MRIGRTRSTSEMLTRRLERAQHGQDVVGRPDGPEHDLGRRVRRDDVRRDAALDQPDGVERRAEVGIDGQRQPAQLDERIDQLLDGRLALLGRGGMRRPALGREPHAEVAARRRRRAGCRSARR